MLGAMTCPLSAQQRRPDQVNPRALLHPRPRRERPGRVDVRRAPGPTPRGRGLECAPGGGAVPGLAPPGPRAGEGGWDVKDRDGRMPDTGRACLCMHQATACCKLLRYAPLTGVTPRVGARAVRHPHSPTPTCTPSTAVHRWAGRDHRRPALRPRYGVRRAAGGLRQLLVPRPHRLVMGGARVPGRNVWTGKGESA